MATYTEKLGLKMPAQTDFYNVDDFNENFRKIDQNAAQSSDIQQVLTLADPIRSNRAPTTADAQFAGKLWVVPEMIFNNMMPNALAQDAGNWNVTAATVSTSGAAATFVGDGTASTIVGEVDMAAVKANDIVYIAAKMAITTDANGATLELLCGGEVIATTSMSVPVAGDNIRLIGHTKVDTAGALKLRVTTMYNSTSAQLGKGVTVSDITILDLTADMCQNFAGIEFSKDAATAYIDTYGNFQTKIYELSEYLWICCGSYGGEYSWRRYGKGSDSEFGYVKLSDDIEGTNKASTGIAASEYALGYLYKIVGGLEVFTFAEINAAGAAGKAPNYFKIGDTKTIQLKNGEQVILEIADFNHDDLTSGGKAPISFIVKNCLSFTGTRYMNSSQTNVGGWANSYMRGTVMAEILAQLPDDLVAVIKQVKKYTTKGNTSVAIQTTSDKLWLPSCIEVGTMTSEAGYISEGSQYPIFTDNKSRIKMYNGSATDWCLRSPYTSNNSYWYYTNSSGGTTFTNATFTNGVVFGLCI